MGELDSESGGRAWYDISTGGCWDKCWVIRRSEVNWGRKGVFVLGCCGVGIKWGWAGGGCIVVLRARDLIAGDRWGLFWGITGSGSNCGWQVGVVLGYYGVGI